MLIIKFKDAWSGYYNVDWGEHPLLWIAYTIDPVAFLLRHSGRQGLKYHHVKYDVETNQQNQWDR